MFKSLQIVFIFIFFSATTHSQEKPREYSPYSRFGIGDMADQNFNVISQFGGAAAGYSDRNLLNPVNPASLGFLKNAAFEVGLSTKFNSLSNGTNTSKFFGGGLDYLAIGLPLVNAINEALDRKQKKVHIGTMFALKPFSFVGYDIAQTDSITGTGRYTRSYTGNGGTYEFKWQNGIDYKGLSGGIGISYVFGRMSYTRQIDLLSVPLPYATVFKDHISLRSFRWNWGLQYRLKLEALEEGVTESSNFLSFGIYGISSQGFNTTTDQLYIRQLLNDATGITDTIRNIKNVSGTGKLPGELALGIYYNKDYKLQASAQYSFSNWSNYLNTAKPEQLKNTRTLSLGLAYTPDINSFDNFLKRVTYRIGLRAGTDPRFFDNEQLKTLTVTFGASAPFVFQRKVSFANFAVEIGNIGIADKLKSKFIQLKLGFTLNDDEWFLKRKYN